MRKGFLPLFSQDTEELGARYFIRDFFLRLVMGDTFSSIAGRVCKGGDKAGRRGRAPFANRGRREGSRMAPACDMSSARFAPLKKDPRVHPHVVQGGLNGWYAHAIRLPIRRTAITIGKSQKLVFSFMKVNNPTSSELSGISVL